MAIAGAALKNVTAGDISKTAATANAGAGATATAGVDEEGEQGFIVLETNYRIYAYTGNFLFPLLLF